MKQRTYTRLDIVAAWYLAFAIPMALLGVVFMVSDVVEFYSAVPLILITPILLAFPVAAFWLAAATVRRAIGLLRRTGEATGSEG